ncbi:MAG TPA: GGDEF domain-containing protein, partial [Spirochaetota bacterium]|nr:GGDEF domain-containing protein [Spirochaetota bacterium]
ERLNYYIVDSFQTIIDSEMINKQKREIEKLNHEITELSKIDFLTNLLNRRAFFEALEAEKKRTVRDNWRLTATTHCVKDCSYDFTANPDGKFLDHYGRFCCVLIDIDFFKKINDNYGHLIGDQVLKKIGEVLNNKSIFRENDIIGRYGGEEFILVLPETNSNNAKIPTNRLREYVKTIDFYDDKGNVFHISISIGLSEFNPNDKTNEDLIQRADQALYVAKQQGRDRVVVYEEIF